MEHRNDAEADATGGPAGPSVAAVGPRPGGARHRRGIPATPGRRGRIGVDRKCGDGASGLRDQWVRRASTKLRANATVAQDSARRVFSMGARRAELSRTSTRPSSSTIRPSIEIAWRRMVRAGVERWRWAAESRAAAAARTMADAGRDRSWAKAAVSTGNAPHPRAKPRSVWTRPPNNSRL